MTDHAYLGPPSGVTVRLHDPPVALAVNGIGLHAGHLFSIYNTWRASSTGSAICSVNSILAVNTPIPT